MDKYSIFNSHFGAQAPKLRFDPNLNQFVNPAVPQAPLPSTAPVKQTSRGGTLSSLISEGGAVGGGALGASIGTGILPGLGTLVGGALGAGVGAFTGRLAENKVRDNRLGLGDAAQEGALSAVLGASPFKLGKAAITAKKGGATLEQALAKYAPSVAAPIAQASAPARTSISGKLDELANKALTGQYGTISKPVARATNPEKTFSKLAEIGVTKPSDVERISNAITGANGILNKAVVRATGSSARVNVDGLRQTFTDAMENNGVVGTKAKELTSMFDAQMKRLMGGPEGSLSPTADPSDVLDVMKAFEKRIAQKSGKGGNYRLATDETTNQASALRQVVDDLQGRLESGANVKDMLNPQLRSKLLSLHPNSAEWQNFVDNKVMKAKDIKSLRSAQSPFVNASKIINEADLNSMTFGGRVGNGANGIRETLMNALVTPLKDPGRRLAASTLKTASKVTSGVPDVSVPKGLAPIPAGLRIGAKSQIGEGLVSGLKANAQSDPSSMTSMPLNMSLNSALTDGPTNQTTNSNMASGQLNPNMNNAANAMSMNNITDSQYPNYDNLSSPDSISSGSSPYDIANVEQNIHKLVLAGASDKDIQQYLSVASAIQQMKANAAKTSGGLNSTTATQVAASANATNTLDQLESLFGTAGGGSGRLSGSLKNALAKGGLDGNTQTYNDLSAASVSQLARALNGGGQVSDADAAVVVQALPRITDNKDVAARKFAALRARLMAARQNSLFYGGGSGGSQSTDLVGALGG
jgi:hypothetical protein